MRALAPSLPPSPACRRRCCAMGQLIQAAQLHLQNGERSVEAAQKLLTASERGPAQDFLSRWQEDELRDQLWAQGIREVKNQDWESAKVRPLRAPAPPLPACVCLRRRGRRSPGAAPGEGGGG